MGIFFLTPMVLRTFLFDKLVKNRDILDVLKDGYFNTKALEFS
jgi:hypothetical protein